MEINWLTLFLMVEGILVIVVLILSARITNKLIRKVGKDLTLLAQFTLKDYQERQAKVEPPPDQVTEEPAKVDPPAKDQDPPDQEPAKPKRKMSQKAKDALARGRETRKANIAKKAVTK